MTWRAAMEPLSFRAFRLLLVGRLADNLAHAIAPIALAFAVLDLGGSASQLGLVLAARAIPTVVLILVGGVIADRLPRRVVLVTCPNATLTAGWERESEAAPLYSAAAHGRPQDENLHVAPRQAPRRAAQRL